MIEPLSPRATARQVAEKFGGIEPLIAARLAEHGPLWPDFRRALGDVAEEWCHTYPLPLGRCEAAWRELRTLLCDAWETAALYAAPVAPTKGDGIDAYARQGGPLPSVGPIAESFWAGIAGRKGVRMGVPGSIQRRAYNAGVLRDMAEPGLDAMAHPYRNSNLKG